MRKERGMTLATQDEIVDAEIVLNDEQAEEFDLRFQYALGGYAEARQELVECVQCVRGSNVAERLGFKSRGDYIADRVANLNVKWAVDDRRSLVELMAYDKDGGMSTRQIGSALGVSFKTAARDLESVSNDTDDPRRVQSSDGITRTYEAKPEPTVSEREWPDVPTPEPQHDSMTVALINDLRGPWRRGITSTAKKMTPQERALLIDAIENTLNELKEI